MATDPTTGQNIFGRYHVGIHNVGSYQVSGIPWMSGSALAQDVHFAPTGSAISPVVVSHRYITMNSAEDAYTFNVKAKEIYISATGSADGIGYECVAELTNIPAAGMYVHTGSGISDSA